jgi:excisionase family DNA binding protein
VVARRAFKRTSLAEGIVADDLFLRVSSELIEVIAQRVADVLEERLGGAGPTYSSSGAWMRTRDAAEYLGWTTGALRSRIKRNEVPHYKVEGTLLFKRDELDQWLSTFRQDRAASASAPTRHDRRRHTRAPQQRSPLKIEAAHTKPRKPRPLPPHLGGSEDDKRRWALGLEITRAELDNMSPSDFKKAWGARNERLEAAGVFDRVDALAALCGWDELAEMTPTALIEAVSKLDSKT